METPPFVAVGAFSAAQARTIAEAARAAGHEIQFVDLMEDASAWKDTSTIAGLLIDGSSGSASKVVLSCRSDAKYSALPLLVLAREVSDLGYTEAFNWGADDHVGLNAIHGLVRRLRSLPPETPPLPQPNQGTVVIAYPDHARRLIAARVFRNAGYSVTFAVSAAEASTHASNDSTAMILMDSSLTDSPAATIGDARREGGRATWIISSTPRELHQTHSAIAGLGNAATVDGFGPPENALFCYNELKSGGRTDQRSSPRLLYGTSIAFRPEGQDDDDFGFSYNVSEGGLYVRTVAPPIQNTIWLELVPPRTDRRVRLVADVAWRAPFSRSTQAQVPPGFGVRIVDGAARDLETWRSGCATFAQAFM